jgi:hypothetical protein
MGKNLFTSTHIVLLADENNNLVKFSDFKSVKDFKKFLKKNHLTYDAGEGCFISTNDDGHTSYIYICEKAYYEETGNIADWDHDGLSNYFYDRAAEGLTWGEDCESAWYVCGNYENTEDENLDKIFNDLKTIDGVEIELEFYDDYDFMDCELRYLTKK